MVARLIRRIEVGLKAEAMDGCAACQLPLKEGKHQPALPVSFRRGIFETHFIEDEDRARIDLRNPTEGRPDIAPSEGPEKGRGA